MADCNCDWKRFTISTIAVFIFVFIFEFIVHGMLLKGIYDQTAHLWRPQEEFSMAFMMISQLGFSSIIAFLFTRNFEGKGIKEGLRFGLFTGLLLGSVKVGTYCYMPIPAILTASWVVADIVKCLGAGIALSFVYRK